MGEMVGLIAADGHTLDAYEAGPRGATAGIVIIQEIFGVNEHIRSLVDRYAGLGYRTIAPALFDRAERNVEFEYDAEGLTRGQAMRDRIGWNWATTDIDAARNYLADTGPVATIGYCYGGSLAWLAACELQFTASVCYYGGHIHANLDLAPTCPTIIHFGELDPQSPPEEVADLQAAHPDVPIYVYDGAEHGFNCDLRSSYHPTAAALAFDRTTEFLTKHLGTPGAGT